MQQSYSSSLTCSQTQSVDQALSNIKDDLREVIPHEVMERNVLMGENYLISADEPHGLQWNKITKAIGAQALGALTVASAERLDLTVFKKA